jgi:hypothetical protein
MFGFVISHADIDMMVVTYVAIAPARKSENLQWTDVML